MNKAQEMKMIAEERQQELAAIKDVTYKDLLQQVNGVANCGQFEWKGELGDDTPPYIVEALANMLRSDGFGGSISYGSNFDATVVITWG